MNSAATDIAGFLVDAGLGVLGTSIFVSQEPDSPDNCITVYDFSGYPIDGLDVEKEAEMSNFQIRVRNNTFAGAQVVIEAIRNAINLSKWNEVGTTVYEGIWRVDLPISLPRDHQNRVLLTQNWRCLRYEET